MIPEKRTEEFNSSIHKLTHDTNRSKESRLPFDLEAARMLGLNKHKEKELAKDKLINILTTLGLIAVFGVVPLTIYCIFATGFVGSKLWLWFLVPLGLPKISILGAAGIAMLVRLFIYAYENPFGYNDGDKERTTPEKVGRVVGILLLPWMTLLIGYIIHINM